MMKRLEEAVKQEIRTKYNNGAVSHKALADEYGVCIATIGNIVRQVPTSTVARVTAKLVRTTTVEFSNSIATVDGKTVVVNGSFEFKLL